jgi:hypothetical protein
VDARSLEGRDVPSGLQVNGNELVPLVRAGAALIAGKIPEPKEAQTGTTDSTTPQLLRK